MKKLTYIISLLLALSMLFSSCADAGRDDVTTESEIEFESTKVTETETENETEPETVPETELETEPETEPSRDPIHVDGLTLDRYEVNINVGEWEMPWVTMTPDDADDKSEYWTSNNTAVATVDAYGNIYGVGEGSCTVTVASVDNQTLKADVAVNVSPKPVETEAPAPTPDPPATTGVTYISGILVVNKTYPLPADYNPGVDPTAYAALTEMFGGAAAEGISLWVASGFRSYDTQNWLYNNYVAMDGKEAADTYSARPGHSEHQTGLAFDLNIVADYFAYTTEGIWLANNCWKYGFIIRYPLGKEGITGYKYEPWHVRYLGKDVAKAVYESGLCLEEYLGITSVYSY